MMELLPKIARFFSWINEVPKPSDVKALQTDSARVDFLNREVAQHPSRGLTPAGMALIFQEAEQGNLMRQAELFMDMREKDAHIDAELSKRIMAAKKLDWMLEPCRDASATEKKRTRELECLIRDKLEIGQIRADMLDAIGHGYSCIELGWTLDPQGRRYPNITEQRPPTWFVSPLYDRGTLHLRNFESFYGEPLQPFGWIPHIHKSRSGYLARTGLYRSLAWPYLYKNYSVRDLAEFLEIYGLPIRIGKYNTDATEKEKTDLLRTVLSIGHNAAGIIPDTMQMELHNSTGGSGADGFSTMIALCEAQQSKAILGGTLTSQTGANGNHSLGKVHNEVRQDIRDDDASQVDFSLTTFLVYPMAVLNGLFAADRCPKFVSDIQEPEDLSVLADSLPKLVAVGAKIPARYVNEKLKIPAPEAGEEILAVQQPVSVPSSLPPAPVADTTPLSGLIDKSGQTDIDITPVSAETDLLAAQAAASIEKMIGQVRDLVNQAESLDALRDDLLTAYADLDNRELVKVMALAFAAADLSGRFDVDAGG